MVALGYTQLQRDTNLAEGKSESSQNLITGYLDTGIQ